MDKNVVVGVFETMADAEETVRRLNESGFPIKQVSIVTQNLQSEREVQGFITTGDVAKGAAGTGAWFGGLFGLLIGAAFLWVPGFGAMIVAGPLASALLGAVEGVVGGAAIGGILGVLVGWGVSKEHVLKYEEKLKGGKHLVIAHGTAEEVQKACSTLECTVLEELEAYGNCDAELSRL